jgi:hypothetical protein
MSQGAAKPWGGLHILMTCMRFDMEVREYLNRLPGSSFIPLGFGLVLLVGSIDYWTGKEINLLFLYLAPVTLIAWFMSRRDGLIISVISVIASFAVESLIGHFYSEPVFLYWNASLRLASFMIVAIILSSMKFSFEENAKLILEIQIALAKTNTFTSRNPICAWCQKVRNEEGRWQGFNSYVKERSIIEVTHGKRF